MADEIKIHPPTERRLARLRALGLVPVSPALVGAAVIAAAWLTLLMAAPMLVRWSALVLTDSLQIAATASTVGDAKRAVALLAMRGAAIGALIGLVCLAAAVTAQQIQTAGWGRGAGAPSGGSLPGAGASAPRVGQGAAEAGWLMMIAAVTILSVLLAARGALAYAEVFISSSAVELLETSQRAVLAIGWRVIAAVVGLGILDCLMHRAAFWQIARMSRREMADELRQTEGHPVTLQRRPSPWIRRQRHV